MIWLRDSNRENTKTNGSQKHVTSFPLCLKINVWSIQKTKTLNQESIASFNTHPLAKEFKQIVKKHWHIISTDPSLKDFSLTPRVVYKRPANLNIKLVIAQLPILTKPHFLQNVPNGNYKCGNCAQCNFTHKTSTFTHPRTGASYKIKGVISCNTNNVIYMLKCPCGLVYIGKATRALKIWISEHRSNICNKDERSPVAVHFNQFHHNVSSLKYCGIEQVKLPSRGGDINSLLLKREAF